MNTQELHLISPIPPSVNHYLAVRAILKSGKPLAIPYETPEAKRYKAEFKYHVRTEVKRQNFHSDLNPKQHFYCDCIFYFDRIDRDPNNYFKCMLDAITETQLVWADDNTVCERVMKICYDSKNPRIEIVIYPVEYIGIFENRTELELFESTCRSCARFKRNCGILKKAKGGRVQGEIQDMVCSKYRGD